MTIDVCHFIDHLDGGGGQAFVLDLIEHMDGDVSHTVCHLKQKSTHSSLRPEFEDAGIRVVGLGADSAFDLSAVRAVVRFFRHAEFDVLHSHTVYAQLAGRIFGRFAGVDATISTYHMTADMWHHDPGLQPLERATRPLEDELVAICGGVRESLSRGEDHWRTIYTGVDLEAYHSRSQTVPDDLRAEFDTGDDAVWFVNVGRFVPAKSQVDLVYAMEKVVERLPEAHLVIAGGGELRDELHAAVESLGLEESVSIHGRADPVFGYYALADVFVLSSVDEGFPLVVLEAMAAGLPVVGTDIPGVNEAVVHGETGLLVPPGSPSDLADAMVQLGSGDRRERFGRRAHERASREFSIERMAAEYLALYREATG